jgi:hypothetical protein
MVLYAIKKGGIPQGNCILVHWSQDVVFREDENRARKGNAQENLAIMRKITLNLLRKEKSQKCGAKGTRLICVMDQDILLKVLHLRKRDCPDRLSRN